jgi:hypothetical protein
MQVIPRRELAQWLRKAGLDPDLRLFPQPEHQITIRETSPPPFVRGPHRKSTHSQNPDAGPTPVCDRPDLSRFVATVFHVAEATCVLAVVPEGAFWLNNKSLSGYLWRVPDALRVSAFLRRRGLTDRFQGGFLIRQAQFHSTLPELAANTFSGGSDVLFAAIAPYPLTVLACRHFDLHIASPDSDLIARISAVVPAQTLRAESIEIPDDSDLPSLWGDES